MDGRLPADCGAKFVIERQLGAGSYGTVYLCKDRASGRESAVKVLHAERADDTESVERFRNEARVTARLDHPSVVRVTDHGDQSGVPWIAYEFIGGPSLETLLEEGPLTCREALVAAGQIASALEAAHAAGILHRDIKPGNVLRGAPGLYKVADFGLARWAEQEQALTKTGFMVGTPLYLPPELFDGAEVGAEGDLYALGVMLFQMLTGMTPWQERGADLIAVRMKRSPEPPSSVVDGLPPVANRLVARMIAREPTQRVPTAAELSRLLAEAARAAPTGKLAARRTMLVAAAGELHQEPAETPTPRKVSGRTAVTPRSKPAVRLPTGDRTAGAQADHPGSAAPLGHAGAAAPLSRAGAIAIAAGLALAVGIGLVVLPGRETAPIARPTATTSASPAAPDAASLASPASPASPAAAKSPRPPPSPRAVAPLDAAALDALERELARADAAFQERWPSYVALGGQWKAADLPRTLEEAARHRTALASEAAGLRAMIDRLSSTQGVRAAVLEQQLLAAFCARNLRAQRLARMEAALAEGRARPGATEAALAAVMLQALLVPYDAASAPDVERWFAAATRAAAAVGAAPKEHAPHVRSLVAAAHAVSRLFRAGAFPPAEHARLKTRTEKFLAEVREAGPLPLAELVARGWALGRAERQAAFDERKALMRAAGDADELFPGALSGLMSFAATLEADLLAPRTGPVRAGRE